MSDTESDSEVFASSDACWSIHNQQGDWDLYPSSPEYYFLVMEAAKGADRGVAGRAGVVEHGGYESSETATGTVTTHNQGMQTDAAMFQRQYQDKGVYANTETGDSLVVQVVVKMVSDGENKRKVEVYEHCRPAKKQRKST